MTYRKSSNQFLAIFSTLIVYGILFAMFYLSHNHELNFSTSANYDKLSFEFQCGPSNISSSSGITIVDEKQQSSTLNYLYCEPTGTSVDPASNGLTPSDLLYQEMMINTAEANNNNNNHNNNINNKISKNNNDHYKNSINSSYSSNNTNKNINNYNNNKNKNIKSKQHNDKLVTPTNIIGLLSSIMMNGIPLLGLNDFILLSDSVNKLIGSHGIKELLLIPGYKEKFSNFLNIRNKTLIFCPTSCWTLSLIKYFNENIELFKDLNYILYHNMDEAIKNSNESTLGIINFDIVYNNKKNYEFMKKCNGIVNNSMLEHWDWNNGIYNYNNNDNNNDNNNNIDNYNIDMNLIIPSITIRMHPSSVPDTRNFEYTMFKSNIPKRPLSGQLLYFTSCFLSFQIEIQNYLTYTFHKNDQTMINTNIYNNDFQNDFKRPIKLVYNLANQIIYANKTHDIYDIIMNTSTSSNNHQPNHHDGNEIYQSYKRPELSFPLYYRAFPTHSNLKVEIFHYNHQHHYHHHRHLCHYHHHHHHHSLLYMIIIVIIMSIKFFTICNPYLSNYRNVLYSLFRIYSGILLVYYFLLVSSYTSVYLPQ